MRSAAITRITGETQISLTLKLDGGGQAKANTGVGFLDHMLAALAKHGMLDLSVECRGDLATGSHHTVEDVGIVLGQALNQALGDKRSLTRYATFTVPMDEALCMVSLDVSGRPFLAFDAAITPGLLGNYETEATEDFFRAVAVSAGMTVHMRQLAGTNSHHIIEAFFKAFARALDAAVRIDPRVQGVPSTKGVL
ncbi:MAG: imidazoleglycerol-phosphate dehydratase HisB [Christensenellaceae bacterium]